MTVRYPLRAQLGQYIPLHIGALTLPVSTTPTSTMYAGTQTVLPTSVSGVVAGQLFTFSGGTGASEDVAVTALTSSDFQGTFANGHSGAYTIVATAINTQNTASITAGSRTVTPVTGTLMTGIVVGLSVHIAAGGGTAEDVVVTGVTATTFTATFGFSHAANTAITLGTASTITLTKGTDINVAGSKIIAPAAMTNIVAGTLLHISAGTGTAEDVVVTAITAHTFTATFANTHSSSWTITTPTALTYIPVGSCVNTTSNTTITAGANVVVHPASLTSITVGKLLNIANGTGTAEDVRVKSVDLVGGTFTADFASNHSGGYTITSKSGTFLGPVIVNSPGSSWTITLYHGSPNLVPLPSNQGIIGTIQPSATGQNLLYAGALDLGLFYTSTGSSAGDVTGHYLDMEV